MAPVKNIVEPDPLIIDFQDLFNPQDIKGQILDLACGDGHNGIYLATLGLPIMLMDISQKALEKAETLAFENKVSINTQTVDLEVIGIDPLPENRYEGILVFRYLHRPLIPAIKKALLEDGILIYETFTTDQAGFGKPNNPDFLLQHGELKELFKGWEIVHYFEGIKNNPERAIAQIVCRKRPL